MAKLVAPNGSVLGVDKVPELVVRARAALAAANPELLAPAGQEQGAGAGGAGPLLRIMHGNVLSGSPCSAGVAARQAALPVLSWQHLCRCALHSPSPPPPGSQQP